MVMPAGLAALLPALLGQQGQGASGGIPGMGMGMGQPSTAPGSAPLPQYDPTGMARIDKKEALLQALLSQGMQAPQGQAGPLSAITQTLSGFAMGKMGNKFDAERKALTQQNQTAQSAEFQDLSRRQASGEDISLAALSSQNPTLQKLGLSMWEQKLKSGVPISKEEILKLADKFDPQSVIMAAQTGDTSLLKPRRASTEEIDGGYKVVQPDGSIKYDFRPKGTNVVTNVSQADPFSAIREGVKGFTGRMDKDAELALSIPSRIESVRRARGLVNQGSVKGLAAPGIEALGQLGASLGFELPQGVKNYAEVRRIMGPAVLDEVRKLAPVTVEDRTYVESITGADAAQDDRTVLKLMEIYENRLNKSAELYNQSREDYGQMIRDPMNFDYSRMYPEVVIPPVNQPTPSDASPPGQRPAGPVKGSQLTPAQRARLQQLRQGQGGGQ